MRNYHLLGAAPLALAVALSSVPAFAQSSGDAPATVGVADIVVTAQKREEKLQDVPIAITAISTQALENQNINSVNDFRRLAVPGLVSSQQTGNPVIGMNIRGISTQDQQVATIEGPIALYIDGVYIPRLVGLGSEILDVERVEVLRGPQGTLFGRNAEGGAISVVSKKPTGKFEGNIGGEFGNYGRKKGHIHLNLPAMGTLSTKVDAYISKSDGFTKNGPKGATTVLTPDQHWNFAEEDSWGVRGQLLWEPSDSFSALLSADYSKLKFAPAYKHFDAPNILLDHAELGNYVKRSDSVWYNPPTVSRVEGASLVLTYDISDDVTVKSISAWRNMRDVGGSQLFTYLAFPGAYAGLTEDGALASGLFADSLVKSKTFSEEVQLIGSAGEFEYTLGAFYFRETAVDQRGNFLTAAASPGATPGTYQLPVPIQPAPLGGPNFHNVRSSTFAIFGQATWTPEAFDGRLKITPGLRYTEASKNGSRVVAGGVVLDPPILRQIPSVSRFDPALTIAYDITSDVNVYVRYAQAFRDGGATVRSPTFAPFGPEVNKQVELGFKGDLFDRLLRLNMAVYHSWVTDQQINVTPPDDATAQDIVNVPGTTRLWGLEAEATLAPTQGLTISGSISLMDGKQPAYNCGGCDRTTIVYLPDVAIGASLDYTTPVGNIGDAFFHFNYKYTSDFHTSPKAFPGEVWPPSGANRADARIGVRGIDFGPVKANIAAYVDNVFDDHSVVFDTNVFFQTLEEPRQFGVQASIDF